MRDITDGGPAFPQSNHPYSQGMSLRDWFAGMALQGMVSNNQAWDLIGELAESKKVAAPMLLAQIALEHADAMIAEREKSTSDMANELACL